MVVEWRDAHVVARSVAQYAPLMRRHTILLLTFALVATACGGGDQALSSALNEVAPADSLGTDEANTALDSELWDLTGIEIRMTQPRLWRAVSSPPEGSDAAVYAPSDNTMVAERVLVKAVLLDSTTSTIAQIEAATNDLEANYADIGVLATAAVQVGRDRNPAQQIRFTWEQPREAGVGWRWVVAAESQVIYITYLADLSEPQLHLGVIQTMLDDAQIGS